MESNPIKEQRQNKVLAFSKLSKPLSFFARRISQNEQSFRFQRATLTTVTIKRTLNRTSSFEWNPFFLPFFGNTMKIVWQQFTSYSLFRCIRSLIRSTLLSLFCEFGENLVKCLPFTYVRCKWRMEFSRCLSVFAYTTQIKFRYTCIVTNGCIYSWPPSHVSTASILISVMSSFTKIINKLSFL